MSHCTYIGAAEPLPRLAFCAGSNDVPKPEIGVKRQCTHCGAKFFDFMKSPIVCPKCGTVYEVASMPARSRTRGKAVEEDEQELQGAEAEVIPIEEADAPEDEKVTAAVPEDDIEVEEDEAAEDDTPREEEEEHSDTISTLKDGEVEGDEER
jgi:uncharacterized protein (TIGR02300 family)